jgi:branched-chain amino acid aminotransferase
MAFLFYFDDMNFVIINGQLQERELTTFRTDNHSYRYGDGLFETMRVENGEIHLGDFHFDRLFDGLRLLKIAPPLSFSPGKLKNDIRTLCSKNDYLRSAKIRLSVCRGNGGLFDCDNNFQYLLECYPMPSSVELKYHEGLVVDTYQDALKSCDQFSNLKSANYLPYVMAALWAKEKNLDDAFVLNQHRRICDATHANIFWFKSGQLFTTLLSEGCVAGVMRRKILLSGLPVTETICPPEVLSDADEIFLSNAVSGIRWIKQYGSKTYTNEQTNRLLSTLMYQ